MLAVEDAKQRLTALSHRIQRYKARKEQYRTNKQNTTWNNILRTERS
jgi:hypothetical protein